MRKGLTTLFGRVVALACLGGSAWAGADTDISNGNYLPVSQNSTAGSTGASHSDYAGLVGKDRDDSEKRLGKLGFKKVHSGTEDGAMFSTWWNASTRECIEMRAKNGRVKTIGPSSRCH